jgi:glycosyltransferase involved in cell wall biosynthesis
VDTNEGKNNNRDPRFRLAVVIPTKDRPGHLRALLTSLAQQSRLPDEVVIVASGGAESEAVASEFECLPVRFIYDPSASTTCARNMGASAVNADIELIAFVDDDVVFERDAIERMVAFWETAPDGVGGAGFNSRLGKLDKETAMKWSLKPVQRWYRWFLGNRRQKKGSVLPNGFPVPYCPTDSTIEVRWLETTAIVFRRGVLERYRFDEAFGGYDYLAFVDFTYSISKQFKLFVVGDAWFSHYSSPIRDSYALGKKQILNRIYFVRKHPELSLPRCLGALVLHTGFNLAVGLMLRDRGYFQRVHGNLVGFIQAAMGRTEPAGGGIK